MNQPSVKTFVEKGVVEAVPAYDKQGLPSPAEEKVLDQAKVNATKALTAEANAPADPESIATLKKDLAALQPEESALAGMWQAVYGPIAADIASVPNTKLDAEASTAIATKLALAQMPPDYHTRKAALDAKRQSLQMTLREAERANLAEKASAVTQGLFKHMVAPFKEAKKATQAIATQQAQVWATASAELQALVAAAELIGHTAGDALAKYEGQWATFAKYDVTQTTWTGEQKSYYHRAIAQVAQSLLDRAKDYQHRALTFCAAANRIITGELVADAPAYQNGELVRVSHPVLGVRTVTNLEHVKALAVGGPMLFTFWTERHLDLLEAEKILTGSLEGLLPALPAPSAPPKPAPVQVPAWVAATVVRGMVYGQTEIIIEDAKESTISAYKEK